MIFRANQNAKTRFFQEKKNPKFIFDPPKWFLPEKSWLSHFDWLGKSIRKMDFQKHCFIEGWKYPETFLLSFYAAEPLMGSLNLFNWFPDTQPDLNKFKNTANIFRNLLFFRVFSTLFKSSKSIRKIWFSHSFSLLLKLDEYWNVKYFDQECQCACYAWLRLAPLLQGCIDIRFLGSLLKGTVENDFVTSPQWGEKKI